MCDCNKSSFFPYREAKGYSNFTQAELRAQCAQENGLDINDPYNAATIDACVASKANKPGAKGEQAIGWISKGGNILTNIAHLLSNPFGEQAPPVDGGAGAGNNQSPKGLGIGAIIGIIAGIALVGYGIYYISKPKTGGK